MISPAIPKDQAAMLARQLVTLDAATVEECGRLGLNKADSAVHCGVTQVTFLRKLRNFPELRDAYNRGRAAAGLPPYEPKERDPDYYNPVKAKKPPKLDEDKSDGGEVYLSKPDSLTTRIKPSVLELVKSGCWNQIHIRNGLQKDFGNVDYSFINTALEQLQIDGEICRVTDEWSGKESYHAAGSEPINHETTVQEQTARFEIKPRTAVRETADKEKTEMASSNWQWQHRITRESLEKAAAEGLSKREAARLMDVTLSQLQSTLDNNDWARAAWKKGVILREEKNGRRDEIVNPAPDAGASSEPAVDSASSEKASAKSIAASVEPVEQAVGTQVKSVHPTRGKTAKIRPLEKADLEKIEELAAAGKSYIEIAAVLKIKIGTMNGYLYNKKYGRADVRDAYGRGRKQFKESFSRRKLRERAPVSTNEPETGASQFDAEIMSSGETRDEVVSDTFSDIPDFSEKGIARQPQDSVAIIERNALAPSISKAAESGAEQLARAFETAFSDVNALCRKLRIEELWQKTYGESSPKLPEILAEIRQRAGF